MEWFFCRYPCAQNTEGKILHMHVHVHVPSAVYYIQQTQNTEALCQAVVTEAERICPELVPQAKSLSDKFQEAFTLFARCHNLYNSGAMSEENIETLGMLISHVTLRH